MNFYLRKPLIIVIHFYRFAEALFEATEYCNDGVEITSVSPEFRLVVRNIILNLCCVFLNLNKQARKNEVKPFSSCI